MYCEGSLGTVSWDRRCTWRSAFDLLHRLLAVSFSIFAFWIIGRYSTASRNCSAMRRLLLFIADLIFSFRAQLTGTLGELPCSFLPSSIHALPQTPNT
ncbi:hypothetical protein H5410_046018 [Solanum commersonii]|uniref:Uncharacterized protein n=1 Tax=Solanum commersonii TaxID=4109 RepID=A0A9J5XFB9_SOLCO|nr:hypothetical protein H5410_046018 [Solanum commersonii]